MRTDKVGSKLTLITRENLKRSCRTFFAYCQRSGWIEVNPVPIERKKRTHEHRLANNKAPGILLPDQVALFMQAIRLHAPQLLAFWAVKFFARIRDAEADRMTWDMIDLEGGEIHLPAGVTKTADQRTVKISNNLRDLLKNLHKAGFVLMDGGKGSHRKFRGKTRKVVMIVPGRDGDDDQPYLERQVQEKIKESQQ